VRQIGCRDELNAAYATEGYARIKGGGAVVTTFNVGSFSALNGVTGAYAENLPVIFVSASYNTNDLSANHLPHHTIGTHDFSYQYEMIRQVTCAAVRVPHPDNAPAMIDHAIGTALRERKPAYIEIACNLSHASCPEPAPFETVVTPQASNPHVLAAAVERASARLADAKKPLLLAGVHLRSFGAIDAFRELADALGCAVAVMPNAKGFFPEDHPRYIGIYLGEVSSPVREAVLDWADLILAAGPLFSDYTTVGWTGLPPRERLISAEPRYVWFPGAEYTHVALAEFLSAVAKSTRTNDVTLKQYQRIVPTAPAEHETSGADASAARHNGISYQLAAATGTSPVLSRERRFSMTMHEVVRFAYEAGQLKRLPRAGWLLVGVHNPESVAEHSFRVAVLAYVIAVLEGADHDRSATLGLFHDLPETRIGDVPSVGRPYVTTADPQLVVHDQVAALPQNLASCIKALITEHENATTPAATPEARCSRDADKLDCLLQAREYQAQGNQLVQPWIDSMAAAVSTETGKSLATTAREISPDIWWVDFAANFNKHPKLTRF
jgi:5'-deoxynucleotidase YfbR-like HD superfamily hydrolase